MRIKRFFQDGYWKDLLEITGILILFYRDIRIIILAGIPLLAAFARRRKAKLSQAWRWKLNLEFQDGLRGISAALYAGYSIENAITESKEELRVLYGKDSVLAAELEGIESKVALNQPIEQAMEEFAERTEVEDIRNFSEILRTARRSGGDLIGITREAADRIGSRIEINREIKTMISGKQMEAKIMNLVPLGIIFYFWICSPGFLDYLYESSRGRIYMTGFLITYMAAREWSRKICMVKLK